MDRAYKEIVENIARIYDRYAAEASKKTDEKRKMTGLPPDKDQKRFFDIVNDVVGPLRQIGQRMGKSESLAKNNQMKTYTNMVLETAGHIENIRKKKSVPVRINKSLLKIAENTVGFPARLTKSLDMLEQGGGFCCGGGDRKKSFRNLLAQFAEYVSSWRLLDEAEQREDAGNYIAPSYQQNEYRFIRDILKKLQLPNPKQPPPQIVEVEKVVEREKIVEVVKYVETGGKPSRLSVANQWVYGINRELNPTLGLEIYHDEADKVNNPVAANILGTVYQQGQLLQKDETRAMGYFMKSVELKDPRGMYLYAKALEKGLLKDGKADKQDLTRAFKLLTQSAEANCIDACIDLGFILQNGSFDSPNDQLFKVQKDLKKAMALYTKARNERSPKASNNIGVFYLKNKYIDENNLSNVINTDANCEKNLKTACRFLEQSASRGFATAYYNLGTLYERGEGVPQSVQKAKDLFYQGATKGDIKCKIFYSFYLMDQTSIFRQNFDEQYRLAVRWLQDAITQSTREDDTAKAYYYLGLYYEYGFGVDQRPQKAVQLFEQSALLMYPPAINKLGHCYFSGFGVKMDKMIAIGYYKQAAEENHDEALVNLGTAYLMGIDKILDKNLALAYEYFEAAMKLGNSDAYVHLSNMYEKGIYVKKDPKLARELLAMAAMKKNQTAIYILQEKGEPVDIQILDSIEHDLFIEPKTIDPNELVPYIKDLNKASMTKK